nr:hypothetical protein QIA19_00210 [Borreliella finlandensis]
MIASPSNVIAFFTNSNGLYFVKYLLGLLLFEKFDVLKYFKISSLGYKLILLFPYFLEAVIFSGSL